MSKAGLAFPDAWVENYDLFVNLLELSDEKDRHVLADAIEANADMIGTNNIQDISKEYLLSFGITGKSADEFLTEIIDWNNSLALVAFKTVVLNRISPYLDEFEILDRLRRVGLSNSAEYLYTLL